MNKNLISFRRHVLRRYTILFGFISSCLLAGCPLRTQEKSVKNGETAISKTREFSSQIKKEGEAMANKYYSMDISNHFTAIAVSINDITLFVDRHRQVMGTEMTFNQYAYNGTNSVRVILSVPPETKEMPLSMDCDIKILEYTQGAKGEEMEKRVLQEINWVWEESMTFPITLEKTFELVLPFDGWAWKSGGVLDSVNLDKEGLKAYIKKFHNLLESRNYPELKPLLQVKSDEMAQALYIPIDEKKTSQDKFFEDIFKDPAWAMKPVDYDGMIITYHAEGRLIEVTDRHGDPILNSVPFRDDSSFGIELFLSHIDGQWVLCR